MRFNLLTYNLYRLLIIIILSGMSLITQSQQKVQVITKTIEKEYAYEDR